jgi:hypothetical protein
LRRPAHGRAAADIVAGTIDEAAERDEAILGRRKAVACAEEGYVCVGVLFDKPTCGVVALARRFVVGPNLAGGEGQAGEMVVVASCAEAGMGVVGVVSDELEALLAVVTETAGADAERVGGRTCLGSQARSWHGWLHLSRRRRQKRK